MYNVRYTTLEIFDGRNFIVLCVGSRLVILLLSGQVCNLMWFQCLVYLINAGDFCLSIQQVSIFVSYGLNVTLQYMFILGYTIGFWLFFILFIWLFLAEIKKLTYFFVYLKSKDNQTLEYNNVSTDGSINPFEPSVNTFL